MKAKIYAGQIGGSYTQIKAFRAGMAKKWFLIQGGTFNGELKGAINSHQVPVDDRTGGMWGCKNAKGHWITIGSWDDCELSKDHVENGLYPEPCEIVQI